MAGTQSNKQERVLFCELYLGNHSIRHNAQSFAALMPQSQTDKLCFVAWVPQKICHFNVSPGQPRLACPWPSFELEPTSNACASYACKFLEISMRILLLSLTQGQSRLACLWPSFEPDLDAYASYACRFSEKFMRILHFVYVTFGHSY